MRTEPPEADPPKRKRRWFQFSLRSMLVITLICAVATDRMATAADFSVEIERLSKDHQGFFQMLHRGLLQLWLASLVKEIA